MSIEVVKFKPYQKGNLEGFADIYVEKWGVEIRGCTLHRKGSQVWVNFPSKEFEDANGEKKYMPLIKFRERSHQDEFSRQVLKSIAKWREENAV